MRKWAEGDHVLALYTEDEQYYEADILEVVGQEYLVVFTEYGNEQFCSPDMLKSLDGDEAQPLQVCVGGVIRTFALTSLTDAE